MATVRSKGPELVVRYAGRRLRIPDHWVEIDDAAMETLRRELGERLEEREGASLSTPRVEETGAVRPTKTDNPPTSERGESRPDEDAGEKE